MCEFILGVDVLGELDLSIIEYVELPEESGCVNKFFCEEVHLFRCEWIDLVNIIIILCFFIVNSLFISRNNRLDLIYNIGDYFYLFEIKKIKWVVN